MKTLPALLLLLTALAGCADPYAPPGDEVGPTADPTDGLPAATPNATQDGLSLSLDPPTGPLRGAAWTLTGSVDANVTLSVVLDHNGTRTTAWTGSADGPLSVPLTLPFGRTRVEATADDGDRAVTAGVDLVREAEGRMTVAYRGDVAKEDRDDGFWLDVDSWPSAPAYEGCEVRHPDHATVHDAMVAWQAETGVGITYGACGQFGVSVEAIDGHESPGFWCYTVDGEAAEFGISLQPWTPGGVIAWDDCVIVLG